MKKARITARRQADKNHQVVTAEGGETLYRRTPCAECPWKTSSPRGAFPAEAYRISAKTAYDLASSTFACHMKGSKRPAICAGFLLRGSYHNLAVRFALSDGRIKMEEVSDGGEELYEDYRAMAIANGVKKSDPILKGCR